MFLGFSSKALIFQNFIVSAHILLPFWMLVLTSRSIECLSWKFGSMKKNEILLSFQERRIFNYCFLYFFFCEVWPLVNKVLNWKGVPFFFFFIFLAFVSLMEQLV